ncbi:hypothetical protein ACFSX9_02775 [Flavobacterium ardleyense]|uniref:Uncharacterized protein n=1 Tax=Flavobacterium ardleyense TaxID=2038737 RepID=A0ABW5Z494_9FLAO
MKRVIIIISFLMFLKPVLPVLEYIVNYDYIVTELCENKSKPELHCNGKCHLTEQLAKASESDNANSSEKKTSFQQAEIVFCQALEFMDFRQIYYPNITSISNNYSNFYFHMNDSYVFHPPILALV